MYFSFRGVVAFLSVFSAAALAKDAACGDCKACFDPISNECMSMTESKCDTMVDYFWCRETTEVMALEEGEKFCGDCASCLDFESGECMSIAEDVCKVSENHMSCHDVAVD
eukprot:Awhi_evm1s4603